MAFLTAIVAPIKRLNAEFDQFYDDVKYILDHGPRVFQIQSALNDRFDYDLRRIYIEDGSDYEPLPIYRDAEAKQAPYVYLESEVSQQAPYLYREEEIDAVGIDFVVFVPASLVFDMEELKAVVDYYRFKDKVYIVQTF